MLNMMASFVILLIARTARIACADRHTHETTSVTLSAYVRRGLITIILWWRRSNNKVYVYNKQSYQKVMAIVLEMKCLLVEKSHEWVVCFVDAAFKLATSSITDPTKLDAWLYPRFSKN